MCLLLLQLFETLFLEAQNGIWNMQSIVRANMTHTSPNTANFS